MSNLTAKAQRAPRKAAISLPAGRQVRLRGEYVSND